MANISQEEARKELARRELERRGLSSEVKSSMSKLKSAGIGAMTGFEEMAHGAISPVLESGYLGQGPKQVSEMMAQERNRRFQEAQQANPMSAGAGRIA